MKYVIESRKSVEQAGADLEAAVTRHDFGSPFEDDRSIGDFSRSWLSRP